MIEDLPPLMGIETEYGIIRENAEDSDPVEESMALLKASDALSVFGAWSYRFENSHQDLRGFRVRSLAQDEEEDEFCEQDRERPYSYHDMKCDRTLSNGARFYNDHTHPEYSTPECNDLFQLVAHDIAGEHIVARAAELRNKALGGPHVQLFKNNTDYVGHSYGTHDNYMVARDVPFESIVSALVSFLVTRQLYAGSGKVGYEGRNESFSGLQLAQRSDFIESILSIETMTQRPIINTRDESHAGKEFRRLHLILGDANMSAYATALKVGATRLALGLVAAGEAPVLELEDPVADVKKISRDLTGRASLRLKSGKTITALEVQEAFCEAAQRCYAGKSEELNWVVSEWARTLSELKHAPEKLADRIDWAIKADLFQGFMEEESLDWDDPWLKSLDLEYHNLDPERGLYRGLEQEGRVLSLFKESEISEAVDNPPQGTRAWIRGNMVRYYTNDIQSIHWTGMKLKDDSVIDLTELTDPDAVEQWMNSNKEQWIWK
ncbi:MAG: proteasome accessory factor PafA2 family protein [Candidatus Nitrohelix vancouverensis]|uniref:Proteasome accessory factor PafA2 family protein n=1 Tax=Candidatus Nitrohelix vancouverensis TaxID=2705534 RepID=A0A7T0G2K0_9BACT|nr:MAG: proteasome accessory factor PafA2 family protein [Candidatus Nitrohelix vancouverensis]